ncbi:SET methyltransferase domain containing protein [Nitzschia inconspicua]|uniref:SET methyltransferase domain containing protein n=1 Tax=Nitzschia inconspicua TaxID=303405 RepID=A0A9K3KTA7_9STRA|nr:SET methyltransferase domain containing protein [Nitzschia inconspicua]
MINEYLGYDTTMDEEDDEEDDEGSALSTTCVLVPLMDMINHSSKDFNTMLSVMGNSEDENQIDDKDDNGSEEQLFYTVVASRDIVEGEELLISYGSQEDSSLELLLHYGFVPEHNPYDADFIAWSGAVDEMPSCWSTSLQDDEGRLKQLILSNSNSVELTILKFRIRMKQAFDEYQTLVANRRGP